MSSSTPTATNQPTLEIESLAQRSLVDLLLDEQGQFSAVEQFSATHENVAGAPSQAKYYEALMPVSQPAPGQQYAFEVDLDTCSGCKSCVVACHTLNGLDEDEAWRSVGALVDTRDALPAVQHVTTACHHCLDPGCLNGCPVKAYDKDPVTGIVKHLDDQCIGCKYCMLMCPYEVPRYNKRLGIVRKCDMCRQRLDSSEAPACVQSCPNAAIAIRIVDVDSKQADQRLVAEAPLSTITQPTTIYKTQSESRKSGLSAQNQPILHAQESHWPLAVMLCLTQASVGVLFWMVIAPIAFATTIDSRIGLLVASALAFAGLNVAPLHLGQPLRAWRVFLGLKTSWLSREAVLFGVYGGILFTTTLIALMETVAPGFSAVMPSWAEAAGVLAGLVSGCAAVFTSGMIYVVTRRVPWRPSRTMPRFYFTAATAGVAACAAVVSFSGSGQLVIAIALGLQLAKVGYDWWIMFAGTRPGEHLHDQRSRRIVTEKLHRLRNLRLASAVVAACSLGLAVVGGNFLSASAPVVLAATVVALVAVLAGEICERLLYFASVSFDSMPGAL
ncbi:MAG: dimethyl sulfoxide reductase anchor subunit [Aureliella sp.]